MKLAFPGVKGGDGPASLTAHNGKVQINGIDIPNVLTYDVHLNADIPYVELRIAVTEIDLPIQATMLG